MIIKLFTIHDKKAEAYLPPFIQPSTDMAKRLFHDSINDEKHAFNKHPEDYSLWEIANFDDSNAAINILSEPMLLQLGLDVFQEPQSDAINQLELALENLKITVQNNTKNIKELLK